MITLKDNSLHYRFNRCLDEVAKLHNNVHTLVLKEVWNPKDGSLFLQDSNRYTADGYKSYWEAVDRTVRYFDSVILKKRDKQRNGHTSSLTLKKSKSSSLKKSDFDQKDLKHHFKWQNPKFNVDKDLEDKKFSKLPPPPPPCHF